MAKRYLSAAITLFVLVFLSKNIYEHWQDLAGIKLTLGGWGLLAIATLIILSAHCWAGYLWWQTLKFLQQNLPLREILPLYLKTNVAKYVPGNIWHYYGRISAITNQGGTMTVATISVLLEPLMMAAAALIIVLLNLPKDFWGLALLGLGITLGWLHPLALNYSLQSLQKLKQRFQQKNSQKLQQDSQQNLSPEIPLIKTYPTFLLLGEIGFLQLRFLGFCLVLGAIAPFPTEDLQTLFSAFSLAWVAGLVIPVPSGLGVFESVMLVLLESHLSSAIILTVVGLLRLVSIIAELIGAGLGSFPVPRRSKFRNH
ncbi:MAG: UPF0104 family protein [Coleofasciculaceae cyanobacterium SM2_1_6]|nr:UPF0104 family protein [Coleofasciculaceae cyanobacterium SM2_1_6]